MLEESAGYGGHSPQKDQNWYVYILKCCDGSNYTGCTSDLTDRLKRHNKRQIPYTKNRYPVKLVTYFESLPYTF